MKTQKWMSLKTQAGEHSHCPCTGSALRNYLNVLCILKLVQKLLEIELILMLYFSSA